MENGAESKEVSRILRAAEAGEPVDMGELLPMVYGQLRRMAAQQMNQERKEHTLQPTALVHEAYLRLVGDHRLAWRSKAHFYGAAAEAMRRILVEYARARGRQKRGGDRQRVAVNMADLVTDANPEEFLAVDDALCRLKEVAPRAGSIAELRLYTGLSVSETADALAVPKRTVERDWAYARTWLYERLQ